MKVTLGFETEEDVALANSSANAPQIKYVAGTWDHFKKQHFDAIYLPRYLLARLRIPTDSGCRIELPESISAKFGIPSRIVTGEITPGAGQVDATSSIRSLLHATLAELSLFSSPVKSFGIYAPFVPLPIAANVFASLLLRAIHFDGYRNRRVRKRVLTRKRATLTASVGSAQSQSEAIYRIKQIMETFNLHLSDLQPAMNASERRRAAITSQRKRTLHSSPFKQSLGPASRAKAIQRKKA